MENWIDQVQRNLNRKMLRRIEEQSIAACQGIFPTTLIISTAACHGWRTPNY